MKQIQTFDTSKMTNAAHFRFMEDLYTRGEADEAVNTKAAAQVLTLKNKVEAEDEALQISQKNLLTDEVKAADSRQDTCYTALKNVVKANLTMTDAEMLKAAKTLWQCIKDYNINVNGKLNDEAGKVENLTTDMDKKYSTEVALLNLTHFVENLKTANEQVRTLMYDRNTEESVKVAGAMKAARVETDEAYKNLVMHVNALQVVDSDNDYEPFIDAVNEQIDKFRKEIKAGKKTTTSTTDKQE